MNDNTEKACIPKSEVEGTSVSLWYNSLAMNMKKLVKPNVSALTAYEAKEIPCKVKLDANEGPYGSEEFCGVLKNIETNRYPDPEAKELKRSISRLFSVRPEQILIGNGSDELIYYLVMTFGGPVLYPVPTFSMYGIIAQGLNERKVEAALDEEFDIDSAAMNAAIRMEKPKLIFLSSPNNPTGNCFSADRMLKIIDATMSKSIVVVDEAYHPFAGSRGFIPLLADYPNLVILRTFSKIGLAGLRVGFMIAGEQIIQEVNKVRLPFNLNALSQAVAVNALKNRSFLKKNVQVIVSEREKLFSALSKLEGVTPFPSEANFILFKVKDAGGTYKGLLKKGVLVRNLNGMADGCLRVTVGAPEENKMFIEALKHVLPEEKKGRQE